MLLAARTDAAAVPISGGAACRKEPRAERDLGDRSLPFIQPDALPDLSAVLAPQRASLAPEDGTASF